MYKNYVNKTRIPKEKKDDGRTKGGGLEGLAPSPRRIKGMGSPPPLGYWLQKKVKRKSRASNEEIKKKHFSAGGWLPIL